MTCRTRGLQIIYVLSPVEFMLVHIRGNQRRFSHGLAVNQSTVELRSREVGNAIAAPKFKCGRARNLPSPKHAVQSHTQEGILEIAGGFFQAQRKDSGHGL